MTEAPLCSFPAVIFDLDGTLLDSAEMWYQASLRALRRFYREQEMEGPYPERAFCESLLGEPPGPLFSSLLPPSHRQASHRERFAQLVQEEEKELLGSGSELAYPGARAALQELRRQGVRLAVASNCDERYLLPALRAAGLLELVELPLCLSSPGISSKSQMVSRALERFGTRSAVMVGDRSFDRQAAWDNGIPFVGFLPGYRQGAEVAQADAHFSRYEELLPLLACRRQRLRPVLESLQASPQVVGVTGRPGAGKSILADELCRWLGEAGGRVRCLSLDAFLRPTPLAADSHLEAAFDLPRVLQTLGEARQGEMTLLEGIFLGHPGIRHAFDLLIQVQAPPATLLRRLAGRGEGEEVLRLHRERFFPAHLEFERQHPPQQWAHFAVEQENLLKPRLAELKRRPLGPAEN